MRLALTYNEVNQKATEWNRTELYEKAWQIPLRKLAAEYGISDVALGKICRKLQIPLPGLGHWTKIQCGHTIPRPPLPDAKDLPVLVRQIPITRTPILVEDVPKLEPIERLKDSATPSVTDAMLAHPLVEKTKQILSDAQTNDRGMLWRGREVDWLDVRVSKARLTRALRIMAAVLYLLEKEGFSIRVQKAGSESTTAVVFGEEIRFGLVEKSRQIKIELPKPKNSTPPSYTYNPIKLEPTGRLSLEVWNHYSTDAQRSWRDSERASLEKQLPKCVAGMMKIALLERAAEDVRAKREKIKQKHIDEATEVLQRIEEEEKRIKGLKREVAAWARAERIRNYLAAVRNAASQEPDSTRRLKILEWISWAEQQADRFDPLKQSPKSIVDEKDEAIRRLHNARWGY